MRKFTAKEQCLLKELIKTDFKETNVINFITKSVLTARGIHYNHEEKSIKLLFKKEDSNAVYEILETIFLINYLEKNDLIVLHSNYKSDFKKNQNFISNDITQEEINQNTNIYCYQKIPTNIYDLIVKYTFSYFFISEELKDLIKNNFETIDEVRHEKELLEAKKQTRLSQLSFILAIIALIISIWTSI